MAPKPNSSVAPTGTVLGPSLAAGATAYRIRASKDAVDSCPTATAAARSGCPYATDDLAPVPLLVAPHEAVVTLCMATGGQPQPSPSVLAASTWVSEQATAIAILVDLSHTDVSVD